MAQFAIGDIHGCITALKTIFDQQFIKAGDSVVFLGDYINRGPDSSGVIEFLLKNSPRYDFIFLKGNHEIMISEARRSRENLMMWLRNGGDATLDSYGIADDPDWEEKISRSHWDFIENSLPFYQTESHIFVHGGMIPGVSPERQEPFDLFWRKYEKPDAYSSSKTLICGHTSRKDGEIANFGHTICIDTYAYGGQWLTCLNTESLDFVQVSEQGKVRKGKITIPHR